MKKYLFILIGLSFFFALPAHAAITRVETECNFVATGSSTITFATSTTAGELIVVGTDAYVGTSDGGVTDNQSDSYSASATTTYSVSGDNSYAAVYYAYNVAAGVTSVHALNGSAQGMLMCASHYKGFTSPSNPLDNFTAFSASSGTPWQSPNETPPNVNDLLVGWAINGGNQCGVSFTVTDPTFTADGTTSGCSGNAGVISDAIATSTASVFYGGTGSGAGNGFSAVIVAFNPAAPPVINSFTPSPSSFLCSGGTLKLAWNVSGDASDTISGIGSVATGTSSTTFSLFSTQTFTLTSQNANGTLTASLTVPVYTCGVIAKNVVADRCIFL